jgi:hypothetical protein
MLSTDGDSVKTDSMNIKSKIDRGLFVTEKAYQYFRYLLPFASSGKRSPINSDRIISVFSDPRGGSTWISDMFCQLPDSMLIWEPLFLFPLYREIRDVGFCFHQYIPEDADWPAAEEYFTKLYDMRISSTRGFRIYALNKSLKGLHRKKHFVYKDCCSNMLLPWLTARFDINPVYVIRHPCAVVASQLKYKHWDYIQNDVKAYFPDKNDRYKDMHILYKDIIDRIKRPEERMAAEWALHNLVPIHHPENDIRWVTVSYERLYKYPEPEITRIFRRLHLEIPESLLPQIRKPSGTALESSKNTIQSGQQLESWRQSLTREQIANILNIVREFGMDLYDDSPEPDYGKIYAGRQETI